ncbi:ArsR family transcriptional regulator [Azorhizobium doebereinerae]|uniref:VpaChn25_0724 family phage protein n=1 Tax=Azorhizobium doebereinerae TaxID=281091 RepID=UPI0012EB9DC2|nr:ArsR family transcriptional regulator [Azorhizobium doebereinerae]
MSLFEQLREEHQALALLSVLHRSGYAGAANSRILADYLEAIGLGALPEVVTARLERLERQGLVKLSLAEDIRVVTLTQRGEEVATGKREAEGVRRPGRDNPY